MRNATYKKILAECPLDVRLNAINEMAFIDLLTELGFRADKMWIEDENDTLEKLCDSAKKATKWQLKEIKRWEKDGRP